MYTGTFFEFDFTDISRNAIKKVTVRFKNQHTGRKGLYGPTFLYPMSNTLAHVFTLKNGSKGFGQCSGSCTTEHYPPG